MSGATHELDPGTSDSQAAGEANTAPADLIGGRSAGAQPMVSTFVRLPAYLVERLKEEAAREKISATVLIRRVLEDHVRGINADLAEIQRRLDRVERALTQP